jgi:hypothetical protein
MAQTPTGLAGPPSAEWIGRGLTRGLSDSTEEPVMGWHRLARPRLPIRWLAALFGARSIAWPRCIKLSMLSAHAETSRRPIPKCDIPETIHGNGFQDVTIVRMPVAASRAPATQFAWDPRVPATRCPRARPSRGNPRLEETKGNSGPDPGPSVDSG